MRRTHRYKWLSMLVCLLLVLSVPQLFAQDEATPEATAEVIIETPTETPTEIPTETPTEIPTETPTEIEEATPEITPEETPESTEIVTPEPTATEAALPTATALPSEPPMSVLWSDTFESGDLAAWILGAGWTLQDDTMQIANSADSLQLQNRIFYNVAAQARFLSTSGAARISVRNNGALNYTAMLDSAGVVTLFRAGEAVQIGVTLPPDGWREMRLSVVENVVRVTINQVEVITWIDNAPLPPGGINISAASDTIETLQVDDFVLWVPTAELALYPTPTETPTEVVDLSSGVEAAVAPPNPNSPPNSSVVNTPRPTLRWSRVTGANRYRIDVADNIGFAPMVVTDYEVASTSAALSAAALTTPLSQGVYYWRVQARETSTNDWSAESTIFSFTVNFARTPANLAVIVAANTNQPTFKWTSAGLPGASYGVEVASDALFNAIAHTSPAVSAVSYRAPPLAHGIYFWRVNVNGSPSPVYNQFTISPPRPAAPRLSSPANNAPTNDNTPLLEWLVTTTSAGGPFTYEVQVDNNTNFSSPEAAGAGLISTSFQSPLLADGRYQWRARTVNNLGVTGAWSSPRRFTVDTLPPGIPALRNPADGAVVPSAQPLLSWFPVSGANRYAVDIATDENFTALVVNAAETNGAAFAPATALAQGTYYWRVTARDAALNWGDESETRQFVINILKKPANGTFFVVPINTRPTFTWTKVKGATGYIVEVARDANFTDIAYTSPLLGASATSHRPNASNPIGHGIYYWRVNVQGPNQASLETISFQFTVSPPAPPVPTIPTTPASTSDSTPDLIWNPVVGAGAVTYEVVLDNNSNFSSPEFSQSGISVTQVTVSPPLAVGGYSWRVRAVNAFGLIGKWSVVKSIAIQPVPPAPVIPNTMPTTTYDPTPDLDWNAVIYSFSAVTYEVQVDNNNDFTSPEFTQNGITATDVTVNPALAFASYNWRARAVNAEGIAGDWSLVNTLTIQPPPPPPAPTIPTTPPNTPTTTLDTTPDLIWTAITYAFGAVTYEVQVDNNVGFGSPEFSQGGIVGTQVTVSPALPFASYNWRVRAVNSANIVGEWSVVRPLTIEPPPPPPKPSIPAYMVTSTTDKTPTLVWNAVTGAGDVTYEVQLDNNVGFGSLEFSQNNITNAQATVNPPLALGSYNWRVRGFNSAGTPGEWSDVQSLSIITSICDVQQSGSIGVVGEQDTFIIPANMGETLYFDAITFATNIVWRLTTPSNIPVFENVNTDYGRYYAPETGNYTLTLSHRLGTGTGAYSFTVACGLDDHFSINIGDAITPNAVNGVARLGAGTINISGNADVYVFNAQPGQKVWFDLQSTTNNNLGWYLYDLDGGLLISDPSFIDDAELTLTRGGSYMLILRFTASGTADYSFRLLNVTDQSFNINVGDAVTTNAVNGSAQLGAGSIEQPGTRDVYNFTGAVGQKVWFDLQSTTNNNLGWYLYDPDGVLLISDPTFIDDAELTLTRGGNYRLILDVSGNGTANYGLRLLNITDQSFTINVGDAVTTNAVNGSGVLGAGSIEQPGTRDVYNFTGAVGQKVWFDLQSTTNNNLGWYLYDPDGVLLISDPTFIDDAELTLTRGGNYRLILDVSGIGLADYSLRLVNITDQFFTLNIGDTVTANAINGISQLGAGRIEQPGTRDIYDFTVTAGQRIRLDYISTTNNQLGWYLYDADGFVLVSDPSFLADVDVLLGRGGAYRLIVDISGVGVADYSFALSNMGAGAASIPPYDNFNISISDTVANNLVNNLPRPGAGNISVANQMDIYTFNNDTLGRTIWFRYLSGGGSYDLSWRLIDPDGFVVFDEWFGNRAYRLTKTGNYRLFVDGYLLETHTYSFQLTTVTNQSFNINIGDLVENNQVNSLPQPGAGNIEQPLTRDIYTFNNNQLGRMVWFRPVLGGGTFNLSWRLIDPDGLVVFDEWFTSQLYRLNKTGNYTLTLYGYELEMHSYSLQMVNITNQSFNINIGDLVENNQVNSIPRLGAGNIEQPGTRDIYTFNNDTLGRQIWFRPVLGGGTFNLSWRLIDPDGLVVFDEWFTSQLYRLTKIGNYSLTVYGYQQETHNYSLQMVNITDQTFNLALGDTVSNGLVNGLPRVGLGNIEQPGTRDVYIFNVTGGQNVSFTNLGASGSFNLSWRLVGPDGLVVFDTWVSNQLHRLTIPGTYKLIVTGYEQETHSYTFQISS